RGAKRRHQSRAAQALLRSGDTSAVVPPVPIPNTEVKRCSPDGSTATGRARVGRRQNKMPGELLIGHFAFFPHAGEPTRRRVRELVFVAHRRTPRCLSSHHRRPRQSFSTNPCVDTEIAVAKTGSTAARSHREFPERKIT